MEALFVAVLEGFCWNTFQLLGYALLYIIQNIKMVPFQVVFEPGEWKEVTGTEIRWIGGAEEPQECFFLPKIHWWRLPCDMGCCRGAASKCVQCLVAHVPLFSWVFQGIPDNKFDWQFVLVAQIPCGRSPECQKKKQMSIDLILDLLLLAFLGRGEFAPALWFRVAAFCSEKLAKPFSYSIIHWYPSCRLCFYWGIILICKYFLREISAPQLHQNFIITQPSKYKVKANLKFSQNA